MVSQQKWNDYIRDDPRCTHFRNRPPTVVSIFRVPKFLKDTKRQAYVPRRVSLGPYHHGSAELPEMGHHKGRALRSMMNRFNANPNLPVDPNDMDSSNSAMEEILTLENRIRNNSNRAIDEILTLENQIRDSYEEDINYNGEKLASMLCLDGCFLIEVLRNLGGDTLSIEEADECYDPIFGEKKLCYSAQYVLTDLLILENQIPFIVLLKLLQLELNTAVGDREKLFKLARGISGVLIPFDIRNLDLHEQRSCHHHHLLDFLHAVIASPASHEGERVDECNCSISIDCCCRMCIRMFQCKSKEPNDTVRIPHAVELRNAGIKFSALQGSIKQIKFDENSATIFLPRITIGDNTKKIFRNLIAYEMCRPSDINYVTCYVDLMDCLIDSEEDVALLRRMRVIKNWLGSDKEVVDLFNSLCKEVTLDLEHVFDDLTEKVNAHYNNEVKVQIGKFVQDHFSSPWKALALTAAIVILLLTMLQTIFTII